MAGKKDPELEYDPSPEFAVEVRADGSLSHFMAFDPRNGPESEDQIAYYQRRCYPGSQSWEVGVPVRVASPRDAAAGEVKAATGG
jgi:hypothetical protein